MLPAFASANPIRYAEDQGPAIINPLFTTTMSEARINELIFEGLYTDNKNLMTSPQLAETLELNEAQTTADITLRQDVYWHDGHPFTAEDVVFTVKTMQNRNTLSTEARQVSWISRIEAQGDHAVRIHFTQPQPNPEDKLFFKILPAHRFQGTTVKRTNPFRTDPIGTGPFQFEQYHDDNSVTLSQWSDYYLSSGISEIIMREVSDKNYQAKLLLYESLEALIRVLQETWQSCRTTVRLSSIPTRPTHGGI